MCLHTTSEGVEGYRGVEGLRVIVRSIRTLNTRGIRGLDLDFSIVHTEHNGNLARIRSTVPGTG